MSLVLALRRSGEPPDVEAHLDVVLGIAVALARTGDHRITDIWVVEQGVETRLSSPGASIDVLRNDATRAEERLDRRKYKLLGIRPDEIDLKAVRLSLRLSGLRRSTSDRKLDRRRDDQSLVRHRERHERLEGFHALNARGRGSACKAAAGP